MENSCLVADVPETNGVLDPLAPKLQSVEKQNFVKKVWETRYQICVLMIISDLDPYNMSMNEITFNDFFVRNMF